jgi:hypothetical protein
VPDLLVNAARDANATGRRQPLEARGHIHPIAEEVIVARHYVADIDADAEHELAVVSQLGITAGDLLLPGDTAAHRLHGARELGHHAVSGGAEDAAVVTHDQIANDLAVSGERRQRALLVGTHQPGVAGDVGREDRGQLALDALFRHGRCPRNGHGARAR